MTERGTLIDFTAEVAANYVANNKVQVDEFPALLQSVFGALKALGEPDVAAASAGKPRPFVPVKKSVTPDYLIDLFTGRKMKSLKRFLRTTHGMTPEQYRAHWNLPRDYPMTAPNYTARRSAIAKATGLGTGERRTQPKPGQVSPPVKRGRSKAAPVA